MHVFYYCVYYIYFPYVFVFPLKRRHKRYLHIFIHLITRIVEVARCVNILWPVMQWEENGKQKYF